MTGYTRVFNEQAGNIIESSDFNNEFQRIDDAFSEVSGHKHDGSTNEGGYIPRISDDSDVNKIVVDEQNSTIVISTDSGGGVSEEQLTITDGAIYPTTTGEVDLGTATNVFGDAYITNLYIDGVLLDPTDTPLVNDTSPQLGGTLDANGNVIDMGTNTITDASVGNWNTAYSWGDHAAAGYASAAHTHTESDITDLGAYLTDAPSNGSEYVRKDGAWAIATSGGGGASTFVDLSDTPASFAGQGSKFVAVNSGATALEFVSAPSGGGGGGGTGIVWTPVMLQSLPLPVLYGTNLPEVYRHVVTDTMLLPAYGHQVLFIHDGAVSAELALNINGVRRGSVFLLSSSGSNLRWGWGTVLLGDYVSGDVFVDNDITLYSGDIITVTSPVADDTDVKALNIALRAIRFPEAYDSAATTPSISVTYDYTSGVEYIAGAGGDTDMAYSGDVSCVEIGLCGFGDFTGFLGPNYRYSFSGDVGPIGPADYDGNGGGGGDSVIRVSARDVSEAASTFNSMAQVGQVNIGSGGGNAYTAMVYAFGPNGYDRVGILLKDYAE